jgi:3-oxoacyl-[acyl-carrier protein] reductase
MDLLKDKVVVVAGAGRNNGRAIALKFAGEGARLALIARREQQALDEVAAGCRDTGAPTISLLGDVTDPADVTRLVGSVIDEFGGIDVLVSVVGVRPHDPFLETTFESWQQTFATNCHALFLLAQAVAPSMIARGGGSIVALGGMAAMRPYASSAALVSSKHALYGLVKSIAVDLGPHGIRANLLNLGHTENKRLNPEWYEKVGDPNSEAATLDTPLRRVGTNAEVANVALFLASDQSSYVTGDRILSTGGLYIS